MRNLILSILLGSSIVFGVGASHNFTDLRIIPKSTANRPAGSEGQIFYNNTTHYAEVFNATSWYQIPGISTADTLTNKTMSGSSNTFTNIPNSATTATNANTASTIVARDASGNFTAGTITATLSGTATNATNVAVTDDSSTNGSEYILWGGNSSGNIATKSSAAKLGWNPSTGTLSLGTAGSAIGKLTYSGNTSGTITVQPQAVAGTYNFNLPTTAGSSGQTLTSQGGGSNAMTWTSPFTNPMTTTGDIVYSSDNSGTPARLGGTSGGYLRSAGSSAPAYFVPGASYLMRGQGSSLGGSVSGDTMVVNFANSIASAGTDISYTPRGTTNAEKYTVNTAGLYGVFVLIREPTVAQNYGIVLNSAGTSTSIGSLAASSVWALNNVSVASRGLFFSAIIPCAANDIIRVQTETGSAPGGASSSDSRFLIIRML